MVINSVTDSCKLTLKCVQQLSDRRVLAGARVRHSFVCNLIIVHLAPTPMRSRKRNKYKIRGMNKKY